MLGIKIKVWLIIFGILTFLFVAIAISTCGKSAHNVKTYSVERYLPDGTVRKSFVTGGELNYRDGGMVIVRECCYPYKDKIIVSGDFIIIFMKEEPCNR